MNRFLDAINRAIGSKDVDVTGSRIGARRAVANNNMPGFALSGKDLGIEIGEHTSL